MSGGLTFQDFFTQAMGEFFTVPRPGLFVVSIAGALSAITDLLHWGMDARFASLDYTLLAVVMLSWLAAAYVTAMAMIEKPSTIVGCIKFTGVTILTLAPIISSVTVLLYASRGGLNNGLMVSSAIVLLVVGFLLSALLPAWPIVQALSKRVVSPTRILRATKGYRWSLILIFFAVGSVNKLAPSVASAANVADAIALALAGAVVAAATLVLTASIAVTAWKFALQRDASLFDA